MFAKHNLWHERLKNVFVPSPAPVAPDGAGFSFSQDSDG
jgi:hypothetical protein